MHRNMHNELLEGAYLFERDLRLGMATSGNGVS